MENINVKPTTLGIAAIIFIVIVTYIIYKYIDNNMKVKLHKQKRKLKKYYETQFNQMFYNNTQNENENENGNENENKNGNKLIEQPTRVIPDGYDSASSSNDSDHADALDNPKIL